MTTRHSIIVAAFAVLVVLAAFLAYRNRQVARSLATVEAKARKFDEHCRALRTAIAAELTQAPDKGTEQDEKRDNELFDQLTSPAVGFAACTSSPLDQARLAVCWANHEYNCIREMASKGLETMRY